VAVAAFIHLPGSKVPADVAFAMAGAQWTFILGIGVALVGMGYLLQYGLSRLPANRAIVILLLELVVAAIAAYVLAGETLRTRDWIGGGLIVFATLLSSLGATGSDAGSKPLEHG
jgi:drug/metabolite transporter (DMT)-like permease